MGLITDAVADRFRQLRRVGRGHRQRHFHDTVATVVVGERIGEVDNKRLVGGHCCRTNRQRVQTMGLITDAVADRFRQLRRVGRGHRQRHFHDTVATVVVGERIGEVDNKRLVGGHCCRTNRQRVQTMGLITDAVADCFRKLCRVGRVHSQRHFHDTVATVVVGERIGEVDNKRLVGGHCCRTNRQRVQTMGLITDAVADRFRQLRRVGRVHRQMESIRGFTPNIMFVIVICSTLNNIHRACYRIICNIIIE